MARKMPRHIVLPNGMWRFIKGKAKSTVKVRRKRMKAHRTKRRVHYMAKRKHYSRKSFGSGGILKAALVGLGTAMVANQVIGQQIPYQDEVVSAVGAKFIGKANLTNSVVAGATPLVLKMLPTVSTGGSFKTSNY